MYTKQQVEAEVDALKKMGLPQQSSQITLSFTLPGAVDRCDTLANSKH